MTHPPHVNCAINARYSLRKPSKGTVVYSLIVRRVQFGARVPRYHWTAVIVLWQINEDDCSQHKFSHWERGSLRCSICFVVFWLLEGSLATIWKPLNFCLLRHSFPFHRWEDDMRCVMLKMIPKTIWKTVGLYPKVVWMGRHHKREQNNHCQDILTVVYSPWWITSVFSGFVFSCIRVSCTTHLGLCHTSSFISYHSANHTNSWWVPMRLSIFPHGHPWPEVYIIFEENSIFRFRVTWHVMPYVCHLIRSCRTFLCPSFCFILSVPSSYGKSRIWVVRM